MSEARTADGFARAPAAATADSTSVLRDRYGRALTYLRVSVTERCNLRCFYCMPSGCTPPRLEGRLDLDEIVEIVRAGARLGIRKVRITGGEPLVRRGLVDFVRTLKSIPEIRELALSTNGTLLAAHAESLRAAGLRRVNISLDSLRPAVFRAVSGRDDLHRVLEGISAARQAGLHPVKVNVVVMRGVNDDELPAILDYARDADVQVRFIEYMPLGLAQEWTGAYVPCSGILDRIRAHLADGTPKQQPGDTATYYALRDGGEVGVISPVSCRFCAMCNRLRLTADGKLRPCLTAEGEVDLRPALRPAFDSSAVADGFFAAVQGRPAHGSYTVAAESRASARAMVAIGG